MKLFSVLAVLMILALMFSVFYSSSSHYAQKIFPGLPEPFGLQSGQNSGHNSGQNSDLQYAQEL